MQASAALSFASLDPATQARERNETVRRFQPLVARLARQLIAKLPASVELDDIMQAGMIGLMDAATRYQTDQGTQFETFATQRVRGAMLDELRQNDWLPRSVRRNQRAVDAAIHALEQDLGRAPLESEIAARLGVALVEYREILIDIRAGLIVSYEEWDEHEGESGTSARHADPAADPLDRLEDKRFRATLVAAIETLPEREQHLMGLYYQHELNFREIAAVLGVTESRVCQLHSQAVSRIRAKLQN
jgi:RNA polymerase sigma factor for flagellar operon FliA